MTRKKKPTGSLIRSSAAEYLTFVAASGAGGVELRRRERVAQPKDDGAALRCRGPDHQLPLEEGVRGQRAGGGRSS
jgi:hypothetical protein